MNDEFKTAFALIGALTSIVVLCFLAAAVAYGIKEGIKLFYYSQKVKHRFDKPPTAKCYCVDCKMHSENGRCGKFDGWSTADNWFCWDAIPRVKGKEK